MNCALEWRWNSMHVRLCIRYRTIYTWHSLLHDISSHYLTVFILRLLPLHMSIPIYGLSDIIHIYIIILHYCPHVQVLPYVWMNELEFVRHVYLCRPITWSWSWDRPRSDQHKTHSVNLPSLTVAFSHRREINWFQT